MAVHRVRFTLWRMMLAVATVAAMLTAVRGYRLHVRQYYEAMAGYHAREEDRLREEAALHAHIAKAKQLDPQMAALWDGQTQLILQGAAKHARQRRAFEARLSSGDPLELLWFK
jgi:hypothetical protein